MKSTALPRNLADWLDRQPTPKKRKRIPAMSAKRAVQMREYKKLLPGWLAEHPTCEIGPVFKAAGIPVKCNGRSTHPHHVRGRIGELLCDTRFFKASCDGDCHPWAVHRGYVGASYKLGLLA